MRIIILVSPSRWPFRAGVISLIKRASAITSSCLLGYERRISVFSNISEAAILCWCLSRLCAIGLIHFGNDFWTDLPASPPCSLRIGWRVDTPALNTYTCRLRGIACFLRFCEGCFWGSDFATFFLCRKLEGLFLLVVVCKHVYVLCWKHSSSDTYPSTHDLQMMMYF